MGPTYEEISRLAYQLWEERGRPAGSPELDWKRAETVLQIESTRLMQTPADRDEAMAESRLAEEDAVIHSNAAATSDGRKRRSSRAASDKASKPQ